MRDGPSLKQLGHARLGRIQAEMAIGQGGGHAALRGPLEETQLDQEGLVNFFEGLALLPHRHGEGRQAHRSAAELFDGGHEDGPIHVIETEAVDAQLARLEAIARDKGQALASGSVLSVTVDRLARWSRTLEAKGLQLVPVTALASTAGPSSTGSIR